MFARYNSMLLALVRRIVFIRQSMTSNYRDVTFATNLYVFVENVLFIDI